jgi:heme O synthase-like polyprenyltransferase
MKKRVKQQIKWILLTAIIMILGLILFKYIPMFIFGKEILFDASLHITAIFFILYVGYYFIDQNKKWVPPYFIFSASILTIFSIQRIIAQKHNEIGILLGFIISIIAITLPRIKEIKRKLIF